MVEIDSGDGADLGVVQCGSTVDAGVAADVRSDPIGGLIQRVGQNGEFPSLKGNVGVSDPFIFEAERWVDGDMLATVAELVSVVEKLTVADVESFGVGEGAMADGGEGGGEAEEEDEVEEENEIGVGIHLE